VAQLPDVVGDPRLRPSLSKNSSFWQ
jgi:hypothetical protein